MENQWALGQVFIRENNLRLKWSAVSSQFSVSVSFKNPQEPNSQAFAYTISAVVMISLVLLVWVLTREKFKRITDQNNQFKKIKILTSNFELDVEPEFHDIFRAQQADKDFISGKEGAQTAT